MNYLKKSKEKIIETFDSNSELGLTSKKVKEIQKSTGLNKFDEEKKETLLDKITHQLKEITTLILLFAAIISLYLAITTGYGYIEPIVINGRLKTHKDNAKLHGIGMNSISRALSAYNGSLDWKYNKEQKIFSTTIIIQNLTA